MMCRRRSRPSYPLSIRTLVARNFSPTYAVPAVAAYSCDYCEGTSGGQEGRKRERQGNADTSRMGATKERFTVQAG